MRHTLRTIAAAAAVALIATACGDAPDEDADTGATTEESATDEATDEATDDASESASEPAEAEGEVLACQVTDTGGVDDRSFNQTAFAGLERAEEELGVEARVLESQTDADYSTFINQFINDGCEVIITVGFLLDQATQTAAQENPDQLFAIIDVDFAEFDEEGNFVGDIEYDNVRELTFQTDQAAFLAGYGAAASSETGTVGTFGGLNIPPVTIFMDGFLAGVAFYNQETGSDVQVLGWDGTTGQFIDSFDAQDAARTTTDQLIANGADIVMPVAGPAGLGTVAAAQDADGVQVIWVDTDGRISVPDAADVFLTSVQKNMDLAVFETVRQVVNDEFDPGLYVGTLENGGVGIPEDSFEGDLATRVDELRQGIIDGEISVDPATYL